MTSITNHHLVAAELGAAADAYRTAVDGPSAETEAEAGERWNRALEAATALLQADPAAPANNLPAGSRVLWLNPALAGYGEPLAILPGIVRDEAYPDSAEPESPERRYMVQFTDNPWHEPTERVVRAGDLIAVPTRMETRRAG